MRSLNLFDYSRPRSVSHHTLQSLTCGCLPAVSLATVGNDVPIVMDEPPAPLVGAVLIQFELGLARFACHRDIVDRVVDSSSEFILGFIHLLLAVDHLALGFSRNCLVVVGRPLQFNFEFGFVVLGFVPSGKSKPSGGSMLATDSSSKPSGDSFSLPSWPTSTASPPSSSVTTIRDVVAVLLYTNVSKSSLYPWSTASRNAR